MERVLLPGTGTDTAWRSAARSLAARGVRPERVLWQMEGDAAELFAARPSAPAPAAPRLNVPRAFVSLAAAVVWHRDPERFARLYALLWRLRDAPGLMNDRADSALARLRLMEKAVQRDLHKMKAFLRFRDIGAPDASRRSFAAWFEPAHRIVEPVAPFFARRFGDMDWLIVTPGASAAFRDGRLTLGPGGSRPDLPEDGAEALWTTYFRNIFNPARLKVSAMTSEMPRKYWKNLPEAAAIPGLIAGADARARAMAAAAPTLPPPRAARIRERLAAPAVSRSMTASFAALRRRAEEENRSLPDGYGRIVLGEGPADAGLMIVGEQPGEAEDRAGRPFVGPAGQLFDRLAAEAGLDRSRAYVTNAVKRFKFVQRGKRRIHRTPDRGDIEQARWWLRSEIEILRPRLILALGGTAAETLTGSRKGILSRRGRVEQTDEGPVFLTVHPSYLLRLPDPVVRAREEGRFRDDLSAALDHLR